MKNDIIFYEDEKKDIPQAKVHLSPKEKLMQAERQKYSPEELAKLSDKELNARAKDHNSNIQYSRQAEDEARKRVESNSGSWNPIKNFRNKKEAEKLNSNIAQDHSNYGRASQNIEREMENRTRAREERAENRRKLIKKAIPVAAIGAAAMAGNELRKVHKWNTYGCDKIKDEKEKKACKKFRAQ